jgi:hypothetical protein
MWLSKMTRTGFLFPAESRPATEGFMNGFVGDKAVGGSKVSSRRGSVSSFVSGTSSGLTGEAMGSSEEDSLHDEVVTNSFPLDGSLPPTLPGNAVFTVSEEERRRRENPVLMVMTHPELEPWHKIAIRTSVEEYGIGVIFVPLYEEEVMWVPLYEADDEDEDLSVLKPLDPTTMAGFPIALTGNGKTDGGGGGLEEEIKVRIDVTGDVEGKTRAVIEGVRDVLGLNA